MSVILKKAKCGEHVDASYNIVYYKEKFFLENYDNALCLARMLSFAADEAGELAATDCQQLINLALRELKKQFGLNDDIIGMSSELN